MMTAKTRLKLDSMLIKGIIVTVLTLLMLIPINLVKSLIEERAKSKVEVTQEITSKWGGEQSIIGPVLIIPHLKYKAIKRSTPNEEKAYEEYIDFAYLLPEKYDVKSDTKVGERSRSIYNTLVYQSESMIEGRFDISKIEELNIPSEDILWKESFLVLGSTYMQGIKNKVVLKIKGKDYEAVPGVPLNTVINSGLSIKYPINVEEDSKQFDFTMKLNLNGSEKLQIAPIGKENTIKIKSDWNTVSFSGDFLPSNRSFNKEGFDAKWNIYDYNRNYMQMWVGDNNIAMPEVGIDLKYSVDQYQMSMRSIKYAIMFITLTFVIFFFVEIITKKKIHPVQYALVSLALILFYTLLISLSEHIDFTISYIIASFAIIAMIALYTKSIFKKWTFTLAIGGFIAAIYTYLYVILQLEDLALLIGSIGLFIVLAAIMYASRNIDWYKKEENVDNTSY